MRSRRRTDRIPFLAPLALEAENGNKLCPLLPGKRGTRLSGALLDSVMGLAARHPGMQGKDKLLYATYAFGSSASSSA